MKDGSKSYKIILLIGVLLCVFLIVWKFFFAGEKDEVQKPETPKEEIQISVQNIEAIQFGGIIVDASEIDVQEFVELLSEVTPIAGEDTVQLEEHAYIVTLHGEERSKENFFFYQDAESKERWYVKDEEQRLFQNAEFITEYIKVSADDYAAKGKLKIPDLDVFGQVIGLHQKLKELGAAYSTTDMRAFLAVEVQNQKALYDTEEAAVAAARDFLTKKMAQYEYAVRKGYTLSDEELEERIQKEDAMLKEASGFSELEQCFAQFGTTYDEYQQDRKEYRKVQFTIERLYEEIRDEFSLGNIWVGDRQAKDMNEYWMYYLQDIVFPETENYTNETLNPLLEEAETFYWTHLK